MAKVYWFLGHEQFQPEELIMQAILVEKAGFDGVMVSEHLQPWVDDFGAAGFAFSTLGAIASQTSKIKLLTGVIAPLFRYHPVMVAQASATIDRISNGRFELGIGTGEVLNEHPILTDFPGYKERRLRLIEAIEIIRKLLDNQKLQYDGKYYTVNNFKLYSPPINRVPIYMAGSGPTSLQTAIDYTDGLIASVKSPADTAQAIQQISVKDANKTDFRLITSTFSVYAKDQASATLALKPWRGLRVANRDNIFDPIELQKSADLMDPSEVLSRYHVLSNVDDYFELYSKLVISVKADTIVIQTTSLDQPDLIDKVGKQVLPRLKAL